MTEYTTYGQLKENLNTIGARIIMVKIVTGDSYTLAQWEEYLRLILKEDWCSYKMKSCLVTIKVER